MKKELISAFVDSELDEKESEKLLNENRYEMKELVTVYRVIGESIQYNQSQIQVSDTFQARLKEALQKEYSGFPVELATGNDSLSVGIINDRPIKEESVI